MSTFKNRLSPIIVRISAYDTRAAVCAIQHVNKRILRKKRFSYLVIYEVSLPNDECVNKVIRTASHILKFQPKTEFQFF